MKKEKTDRADDDDEHEVWANEHIEFEDVAKAQIKSLSSSEQRKVSSGLAEVYGKCLDLLVRLRAQTYIHMDEVSTLSLLRGERVIFLLPGDYIARVTICGSTFKWTVNSLGMPGAHRYHQVQKIP